MRDTTFTEDASKIHTGHGPDNMATLRNLAINALRAAGHHSIAAASDTPPTNPPTAHSTYWASADHRVHKLTGLCNGPALVGPQLTRRQVRRTTRVIYRGETQGFGFVGRRWRGILR